MTWLLNETGMAGATFRSTNQGRSPSGGLPENINLLKDPEYSGSCTKLPLPMGLTSSRYTWSRGPGKIGANIPLSRTVGDTSMGDTVADTSKAAEHVQE
ncbi:hypothetical protein U1Q18_041656 [Sarracenia purpurea var. burkii]